MTKTFFMKYTVLILLTIGAMAFVRPNRALHSARYLHLTSWDSTKNWRIYKLQKFNQVVRMPADSLRFLEGISLNDDSMHGFLSSCKKLSATNPAWMGCYLASYESSGAQIKKVIISQYAGFFYSEYDNSFYEVDSEDQQQWLSFLSNSYQNIFQNSGK